jgi:hypothetical protein
MPLTAFFPAWSCRLNPMGSRFASTLRQVTALTLCQLEACLAAHIPSDLFPKAVSGSNSRDHLYTRWRTFWCLLWQALTPGASGREVVRQLQALFVLENGPYLSSNDGAYCRAKARLPLDQFKTAVHATAQCADKLAAAPPLLQSRPIKIVDGSTLLMEDTPKNRAAFPPVETGQAPGFPLMRFVALMSLLSGAITAVAQSSWAVSELALLHSLSGELSANDVLVGDRGFGCYPVIAWLKHLLGVDFIGRTTRHTDGRSRLKRLGRNDWLVGWQKSSTCRSPWLEAAQQVLLPAQMTLRVVKCSTFQKGFRVRRLTVVTTLLDPVLYPAQEILNAYLRRWKMEMCLDDLKTTLQMDFLRGRTPEMVRKEFYTRLIAHNLLRCTMAEAARQHAVNLDRISFKGALDALRHFTHASACARTKAKRKDLWDAFLDTLARDLVPLRLDRREPRAIKRRKNKYPRLHGSRRRFEDRPGRNKRASMARLRKLSLM